MKKFLFPFLAAGSLFAQDFDIELKEVDQPKNEYFYIGLEGLGVTSGIVPIGGCGGFDFGWRKKIHDSHTFDANLGYYFHGNYLNLQANYLYYFNQLKMTGPYVGAGFTTLFPTNEYQQAVIDFPLTVGYQFSESFPTFLQLQILPYATAQFSRFVDSPIGLFTMNFGVGF